MCCGCVQWCDTDEPLVVVMNNIVPPTVQSVWRIGKEHPAGRKRVFCLFVFWWSQAPEATQDMCAGWGIFACACAWNLAWCIATAVGGDGETAGRAKGECNEEWVWQPQWLLCSHSLVPVTASRWLICEVTESFHSTYTTYTHAEERASLCVFVCVCVTLH